MNYKESKLILEEIKKAKKIVLTSHHHPDDDSISSILALYYFLTTNLRLSENDISMIVTGERLNKWDYFQNYSKIKFVGDLYTHLENTDLLVMLDGDRWSRFSPNETISEFRGKSICIDHHPKSESTFDIYLVDENTSSTAEILFNLLFQNKTLKKEICEILLMGILGDTDYFRYILPRFSDSLRIAKILIDKGIIDVENLRSKYDEISQLGFPVFQNLINNTKINRVKNWPPFIVSYSDRKLLEKVNKEDSKNAYVKFYGYLKSISGVDWGFVVIPETDGSCTLSFRSRYNTVDVRHITRTMGIGSGMPWAAGAKVDKENPPDVINYILNYIKKNKPVFYKV